MYRFLHPFRHQQTDQPGSGHNHNIHNNHNKVDNHKIADRFSDSRQRDSKHKSAHIRLEHIRHKQRHKLRQPDADQKAGAQRKQSDQDRLCQQDTDNRASSHAQRKINSQFLLSPAYQKTAGIDDQEAQNKGNNHAHAGKRGIHSIYNTGFGSGQFHHGRLVADGIEHIKNADAQKQGKKVNRIIFYALSDIF